MAALEKYEGKILKLLSSKSVGFTAKHNAPSDPKGYVFYFGDCKFDANELEVGDTLYYQFYPTDNNRVTPVGFRKKNNNQYKGKKNRIRNPKKIKPKWHPKYMEIVFFGKIERLTGNTGGYILRMTSKKKSQLLYFCIPHNMRFEDRNRLKIGAWIKFKIGTDLNSKRRNNLVAYDIELSSDPRTVYQELKLYKGEIIKLPNNSKKGWLYCQDIDQMFAFEFNSVNVVLNIQSIVWFKINKNKNGYANDIIPCATKSKNEILQYLTQSGENKHNAPFYIKDRRLNQLENQNHEFKSYSPFFRGLVDVESIIEIGEKYINAFMNSIGGIIYFGIKDDGSIVGQSYMTRTKLDQIQIGITNKLKLWNPRVYNMETFIKTEFIDIYDDDGYLLPDLKVIKIIVDCIHDNNGNKIMFETGNGTKWIKKLSCVGLVHYNDIEGHFKNTLELDTKCYNEDSDSMDNDNYDNHDKYSAVSVNVEDMNIGDYHDGDDGGDDDDEYHDDNEVNNENFDINDNKEYDINDDNNNNVNNENIECKKCHKKIDLNSALSTDRSCGHKYCTFCCNVIVSDFKSRNQWPKCIVCGADFDENDLKKVLDCDEIFLLNMIVAQAFK